MECGTHAFSVGLFKAVPGNAEQSGVQVVTVKYAHIAIQAGIPGAQFNLLPDAGPLAREQIAGNALEFAFFIQGKKAVEGRPAQQPRVCIVLPPGPGLPYSFVSRVPVPSYVFSQANQYFLLASAKVSCDFGVLSACINNFTIHIELKLMSRIIADTAGREPE